MVIFLIFILYAFPVESQTDYLADRKVSKQSVKRRRSMRAYIDLDKALNLIKTGAYLEGSKKLFLSSQNPKLKKRRMEIRFILGKTFLEMGLPHSASFQFVSVIDIGDSRYVRRSLEHLSQIASHLGDDKILQFAVKRDGAKRVKGESRYSLYYQYGKYQLRQKHYRRAISYFRKIPRSSLIYNKSRYNLGLAYAELGKIQPAISAFNDITSGNLNITDPVRVAAIMGKARVYYQAKKWSQAVHYYHQIPKDTPFWHDMIFEISWALLQEGKFRSALNGFQTLHSSYYRDYFQPGSLLLRAIIYMYICKYNEMGKVLNLFKATYSPARQWIKDSLRSRRDYYSLVHQSINQSRPEDGSVSRIIAQKIYRESNFKSLDQYLKKLELEKNIIENFPLSWRMSKAGRYSMKLVQVSQKKARAEMNTIVRNHLKSTLSQLDHFFTQGEYLKYEMLRGKRQMLRKKISRKYLGQTQIIQKKSRDFFVQNGFEFWPFKGEYWLDELGNYYYVGLQNCR